MESIALHGGAKEQLLSDFCALKEAQTLEGEPKYLERPTLETLAKIICAQSSGPHKDAPLFELAHFALAIQHFFGPDQLIDHLLSPEKPSANRFQSLFRAQSGPPEIQADHHGVQFAMSGHVFCVRYGRMAVLSALFDFLCAMDQFSYFEDIQDSFDSLFQAPLSQKSVQACANRLGAILRKYRIQHLTYQEADGKFLSVLKYLQDRNEHSDIIVRDEDILDFWTLHNTGKDYRGYRTVFDLFCDFCHALEKTRALKGAVHAAPLGLDREQGELDIADQDISEEAVSDWVSPFLIFDEPEITDIRFFKKASERQPLENLMRYGPDALTFARAFLRYDVFGLVQSGITNDLQVGRGQGSVTARIQGEKNPTYREHLAQFDQILSHLKDLQGATLYLIGDLIGGSPEAEMAQKAFQKIKRKGFDTDADPAPFEQCAPELVRLSDTLTRFLALFDPSTLDHTFDQDQTLFTTQFNRLYGDALS